MPGYSCTIKERMLYSSCKAPLLDLIQSLGVSIAKKVSMTKSYFPVYFIPIYILLCGYVNKIV